MNIILAKKYDSTRRVMVRSFRKINLQNIAVRRYGRLKIYREGKVKDQCFRLALDRKFYDRNEERGKGIFNSNAIFFVFVLVSQL